MAINQQCEAERDRRPMAELYTEDATYGWTSGRTTSSWPSAAAEIRESPSDRRWPAWRACSYPDERVLVDDQLGEVLGLWEQAADATRDDGSPYEVAGLGGSWFRDAGDGMWSWQRGLLRRRQRRRRFLEMIGRGALAPGMQERIERAMAGERLPGHYPREGAGPALGPDCWYPPRSIRTEGGFVEPHGGVRPYWVWLPMRGSPNQRRPDDPRSPP